MKIEYDWAWSEFNDLTLIGKFFAILGILILLLYGLIQLLIPFGIATLIVIGIYKLLYCL